MHELYTTFEKQRGLQDYDLIIFLSVRFFHFRFFQLFIECIACKLQYSFAPSFVQAYIISSSCIRKRLPCCLTTKIIFLNVSKMYAHKLHSI